MPAVLRIAPSGAILPQHAQAAVDGVGVFEVADAAALGVGVEAAPAVGGGERFGGAHAAGRGVEQFSAFVLAALPPRMSQSSSQVQMASVGLCRAGGVVDQARAAVRRGSRVCPPACTSSMCSRVGGAFDRQGTRRLISSMVDRSKSTRLLRGGQDVQHGVGGAAHRDVDPSRCGRRCPWRRCDSGSTDSSSS